jgi:hypothetical protein
MTRSSWFSTLRSSILRSVRFIGWAGQRDGTTETKVSRKQSAAIKDRYRVEPQNWLELEPSYSGHGVAHFSTNPGTVSGPTVVRFAEGGTLTEFVMNVESIETEASISGPDTVFIFVNGLPIPGSPGSFNLGPSANECASVQVTGPNFMLVPAQPSPVTALGGNSEVEFRPYRTIARYKDTSQARYWAVPLLNFVVDFRRSHAALQDHPLRARKTAPYEAAEWPFSFYHESFYRDGNALIGFVCEGEPAFIEPLPDYAERRARAEAGEVVVTAVMVGRLPEDFDDSQADWFPADLVTLLGLASGREVAVPYVDLRSESGGLVARMHTRIGDAGATRQIALIDEKFSGSTGSLLTSFLVSDVRGQVWFRVMLKHLVRGYSQGGSLEDRLNHLFRAVEGAAAGLGLAAGRPLEVDDRVRAEIETRIDELVAALLTIRKAAAAEHQDRIMNLANQVRGVKSNRPSFPTQLRELVSEVGLPDAQWLASFKLRPAHDGRLVTWPQAAGLYRNRIAHSAFIDFDDYDIDNMVMFIRHLSDVLARVMFHLIGFVGHYSPPCGNAGARTYERPNWAQPESLSSSVFGYVE